MASKTYRIHIVYVVSFVLVIFLFQRLHHCVLNLKRSCLEYNFCDVLPLFMFANVTILVKQLNKHRFQKNMWQGRKFSSHCLFYCLFLFYFSSDNVISSYILNSIIFPSLNYLPAGPPNTSTLPDNTRLFIRPVRSLH